MAGGMGDSGVHDDVTQPHTGHLGIVHCLQQYTLQAGQRLQHLSPLHRPARLMDPVFLEGTRLFCLSVPAWRASLHPGQSSLLD